jgi:hypothetical protein
MTTHQPVDLKRYHSENANRYAELMSIIQDLKEASLHFHAGELACAAEKPTYSTQLLAKAHWLAGASLYGRAFKAEGRYVEREALIEQMRPEAQRFHRWLLKMHEQHVSSSAAAADEVIPTVGRVNGDTGIGYLGVRTINPRQSVMQQCFKFISEIRKALETEVAVAYRRFKAEAETLDDRFLNSLPTVKRVQPQMQER